MNIDLNLCASLVPAALALISVIMAIVVMQSLRSGVKTFEQNVEQLGTDIKWFAEDAQKAAASAAAAAARVTAEQLAGTSAVPPPVSRKLSPLEEKKAEISQWYDDFRLCLDEFAIHAKVRLIQLAPESSGLWDEVRGLESTMDVSDFKRRWTQLLEKSRRIVQVVLSASDLDCDSRKSNRKIQQTLDQLLALCGLRMIEPVRGSQVAPHLHETLGTSPLQGHARGTVAELIARGLITADGDVLLKAKIREFD